MAIDFGRMARGVATGYLSAKIANTEANDKMNGEIQKAAGVNFYTNRLPEFYKTERMREKEFKQVASMWGDNFANAAADEGWITGDGNAFNNITSILQKKNIDKSFFKDKKFSTYAERKEERLTGIQDEERMITELSSGSSKIGPMTVRNQLEGLTKDKTTIEDAGTGAATTEAPPANIPGTPIVPIQERSTMEQEPISGTLFTSKAPDVEGVQARYKHIANSVNELGGYTEKIVWGEGGQMNINLFGDRRNEAGAHIALANQLAIENPEEYNQYNAAPAGEQWLKAITVQPFENIASELKLDYETGTGKVEALIGTPGSTLDANKVLANGLTINDTILRSLDNIPSGPKGEINQLVINRFVENIPAELQITIGGRTENYKQYMSNLIGIRSSGFWTTHKV